MSHPVVIDFQPVTLEGLATVAGRIALFVDGGKLSAGGRRLDRLMRGGLSRYLASEAFAKLEPGQSQDLAWPAGLAAEAVQVINLSKKASVEQARKAGAGIGQRLGAAGAVVLAEGHARAAEIAFGLALRAYAFDAHRTTPAKVFGPVVMQVANPESVAQAAAPGAAVAEGVFFTRDLINEPANVLTTAHDLADADDAEEEILIPPAAQPSRHLVRAVRAAEGREGCGVEQEHQKEMSRSLASVRLVSDPEKAIRWLTKLSRVFAEPVRRR